MHSVYNRIDKLFPPFHWTSLAQTLHMQRISNMLCNKIKKRKTNQNEDKKNRCHQASLQDLAFMDLSYLCVCVCVCVCACLSVCVLQSFAHVIL